MQFKIFFSLNRDYSIAYINFWRSQKCFLWRSKICFRMYSLCCVVIRHGVCMSMRRWMTSRDVLPHSGDCAQYQRLYLWLHLKVWSTVKIRRTRDHQNAIVPVGRPRPYSIIILNMRFIPKASLRANSQITASSYILERHLWVNNSIKAKALSPGS